MEGKQLFPVFDVPEIATPSAASERQYKPSVLFDYDEGDFVRDGEGNMVVSSAKEAYLQWCLKTCMTERLEKLAYSADIGVEMAAAMALEPREAVENAVACAVTEALKVNPKTDYLRDFQFDWRGSSLYCTFTLKGKDWDEAVLGFTVQQ